MMKERPGQACEGWTVCVCVVQQEGKHGCTGGNVVRRDQPEWSTMTEPELELL